MRPQADHPSINGIVEHVDEEDGETILRFRYRVTRVWEHHAEDLIESGLGVLPLAFIADIDRAKLPALIRRTSNGSTAKPTLEPSANSGLPSTF